MTNNNAATAAVLNLTGNSGTTVFSGSIQDGLGPVGLLKSGSGVQVLAGSNAYSGPTTVTAGTLKLAAVNELQAVTTPDATTTQTWNGSIGSTFQVNAGDTIIVTQLGLFDANDGPLTNSHVVTLSTTAGTTLGSASLPSGTAAALSGNFRFGYLSSPLTLTPGTYAVWADNVGTDPYYRNANQSINSLTASAFNTGANNELTYVNACWGNSAAYPNNLDGSYLHYAAASFKFYDPNGLIPTNVLFGNTPVQIGAAGTLDLAGGSQTVASLSDFGGGYPLAGGGTVTNNLPSPAVLNLIGSGSTTFSGTIQNGAGTIALVKSGNGVQVLSGTNTYSGGTTVSGGTLQLAGGNALGSGGLTANGGLLDLNGHDLTVAGNNALPSLSGGYPLAGGGVITDNSPGSTTTLTVNQAINTTFGGALLPGAGGRKLALFKAGNGTLTLTGTSTTGSVTVQNAGGLTVNGLLTAPALNVYDNATLAGNGTIVLTSADGLLQTSAAASAFAGSIGGPGPLEVDSGTLTLSGPNVYSGATTVAGGLLSAGAANALSASSDFTVSSGTLDATNSPQSIKSLTMGPLGTLNLYVGNLLTSSGAATLSGTLNLSNLGGLGAGTTELMSYGSYSGNFSSYTPLPSGYNLVYKLGQLDIVSAGFSGSGTWVGGTASWSSSSNWTDGANQGVPGDGSRPAGTDTAAFSGSGSRDVDHARLEFHPRGVELQHVELLRSVAAR